MKRQERNEIKKQQEQNMKKILDSKLINLEKNKQKHDKIKEIEKKSFENLEKYWHDHLKSF